MVHRGRGFVEAEDLGVAQDGARQTQQLALADTEILAGFEHLRVQFVRQLAHERVQVGLLERAPERRVAVHAKRIQVEAHAGRKQHGVLII